MSGSTLSTAPRAPARGAGEDAVLDALDRLTDATGPGPGLTLDTFPDRVDARLGRLAELDQRQRGPLHGVPFLAKGNMAVAGEADPGAGPYAAWTADRDAAAITVLENLGAVLIGRSRFTELALGSSEAEVGAGDACVPNPWDADRTLGGSSSGAAAAVAHGIVPLALGSDTGGSVRIPAAFAGVAGLKPTDGRLPRDGMLPVSWTLDQVGVLGRDVSLVARALGIDLDGDRPQQRPLRVGLVRGVSEGHPRSHPDVAGMLDRAEETLGRAGHAVSVVAVPSFVTCQPTLSTIVSYEAARSHGPALAIGGEPFGTFVAGRMRTGAAMDEGTYLDALKLRRSFRSELDRILDEFDVLVLATIPFPAPRVREVLELGSADHAVLTRLANLAGVPAASVPGAWTAEGLPLGYQVIAARGQDALVLHVAGALSVGRPEDAA